MALPFVFPAGNPVMSERFNYGGQAVIEGVMMRGRQAMAVAVRHPSGEVVVHSETLHGQVRRSRWARQPFIRGVIMLGDTLVLGMRALAYSATVAMDEADDAPVPAAVSVGPDTPAGTGCPRPGSTPVVTSAPSAAGNLSASTVHSADNLPANGAVNRSDGAQPDAPTVAGAQTATSPEPSSVAARSEAAAREAFGGGVMWGTMAVALLFGIGLFFVSPLLLTRVVDPLLPSAAHSVVVEGLIRIGFFFGYVWLIGRIPDVKRVFAYHGAEHKTINAFEAGEPLRPDRVQRYSVAHPRCGTAFLLYVVVLSIFVFAFLGRPSLPVRIASRIALVPVVASIAYELVRFSARSNGRGVAGAMLAPGLALQSLTTREPDDSQVEVAIAALARVLELDGATRLVQPAGLPASVAAPG